MISLIEDHQQQERLEGVAKRCCVRLKLGELFDKDIGLYSKCHSAIMKFKPYILI